MVPSLPPINPEPRMPIRMLSLHPSADTTAIGYSMHLTAQEEGPRGSLPMAHRFPPPTRRDSPPCVLGYSLGFAHPLGATGKKRSIHDRPSLFHISPLLPMGLLIRNFPVPGPSPH